MHQLYQLAATAHVKAGLPQIHFFAPYHVIWSAVYLPSSRFWPLQLIETSGLLTVTLLLGAATIWLVRSRSIESGSAGHRGPDRRSWKWLLAADALAAAAWWLGPWLFGPAAGWPSAAALVVLAVLSAAADIRGRYRARPG